MAKRPVDEETDLQSKRVERTIPENIESRETNYADREDLQETLVRVFNEVEAGFDAQAKRSDSIVDYWDIYNTILNHNQFYQGNSQIFVPIVHDAINARKTRFANQIFPQSGRYLEVTTEDGQIPYGVVSLLEFYVEKMRLATEVVPPLLRSGDIEGQYTIAVEWEEIKRDVVFRNKAVAELEDDPTGHIIDPTEELDSIEEVEIKTSLPSVDVISDADLLVLPATAKSLDAAIECGGSVTIIRRWSKAKIEQMIANKVIDKIEGRLLVKSMDNKKPGRNNADKQAIDAAGIKIDGAGQKTALVYETWTKLTIDKKTRIYRCYFAGVDKILSVKRNPYWCDKLPIFSCAVEKVKGSFKGKSQVEPVCTFQYMANDAVNEGMDSAAYALLPIVMTDPEKNPRIGSMILSMAAIWETSPKDTQFAQMPQMWSAAFDIVSSARAQIMQSLSVNPSQITNQETTKRRQNQAEVAQSQQVDILTTADAVIIIEQGILTPLMQFVMELDHQYRDVPMLVESHGRLGVQAAFEEVDPISHNVKHRIKWFGVEAARTAQQIQQQIAAANVLRGIPPQLYEGYKLDLVPIITHMVENAFGPRLAPLVFKDITKEYGIDPEFENDVLMHGEDLPVSPFDNIQEHMKVHAKALHETNDPHGTIRRHIQAHQAAQIMKMMQMAQGGQPGMGAQPGLPGTPGGAGPGIPGVPPPGAPRIGAQPDAGPGGQQPPGAIHQDQMVDAGRMPR